MVTITTETKVDTIIKHVRDILRNNIIDSQGTLDYSNTLSDSITNISPFTSPWTEDFTNLRTKYTFQSNGNATFQLYSGSVLKDTYNVNDTKFSFVVSYDGRHRVMVATNSITPVTVSTTYSSYSGTRNGSEWIFDGMPDELIKDPHKIKLSKFPLIEVNYSSGPNSRIINISPLKPMFDSNKFSMEIIIFTCGDHGIRDRKQLGDQVINILTDYTPEDSDGDSFMKNDIEISSYITSSDSSYWSVPKIKRGLRILLNLKYAG